MCTKKKKKIKHDCLPILMLLNIMLYIVLAYLMLFVCVMLLFCQWFLQLLFIFMFCLGLLTHSLFVSCINLHHALCF